MMEQERKETKKKIHDYFIEENVKHTVKVFKYGRDKMIDIIYEDYLSEEHVMENIRTLVGPDYLINVKRECSEAMIMEIHYYSIAKKEKCELPKTIHAATTAVKNLIPNYERSWMVAR